MRWIKHMTAAWNDEKITQLIDSGGLEAYGFYWRMLEIIGSQTKESGDKCEVTYSLPALVRLCYSHHHKVSNLLGKLGVTGLMRVSKQELPTGVVYTISCPNILKYRDEYSKKRGKRKHQDNAKCPDKKENVSGQCPEQEQIQIQIQSKSRTKRQAPAVDSDFIATLKNNQAYRGIDIDREHGKAIAWLSANPGRRMTRQFFINWLNRCNPAQKELLPANKTNTKGEIAPPGMKWCPFAETWIPEDQPDVAY